MILFGLLIGVAFHLGISYLIAIQQNKKETTDTGVQKDNLEDSSNVSSIERTDTEVQTDDWENSSDTSSIETVTPSNWNAGETSSVIPTTSEVETQTIAGDVNTEVVPNPNIAENGIVPTNEGHLANVADQLNLIDPFAATPWNAETVSAVIDQLNTFNNLFN